MSEKQKKALLFCRQRLASCLQVSASVSGTHECRVARRWSPCPLQSVRLCVCHSASVLCPRPCDRVSMCGISLCALCGHSDRLPMSVLLLMVRVRVGVVASWCPTSFGLCVSLTAFVQKEVTAEVWF